MLECEETEYTAALLCDAKRCRERLRVSGRTYSEAHATARTEHQWSYSIDTHGLTHHFCANHAEQVTAGWGPARKMPESPEEWRALQTRLMSTAPIELQVAHNTRDAEAKAKRERAKLKPKPPKRKKRK